MTTPPVPPLGRLVAVAASATLTVASLASVPGAGAATGTLAYECTSTNGVGSITLPVVIDTNLPARVVTGQTVPVVVTTTATIPGDTAKAKYDLGARSFDGPWTTRTAFGGAPATIPQTIPRTNLGDQAVANPVTFVATSGAFAWTAPSTPGTVDVTAGGLEGTWQYYDQDGVSLGTSAMTCNLPPGKPPVVDTVAVVASSTTTLALSNTGTVHGQDVTATARVATSSGSPDGDVAFSVDGAAPTKARVDKTGVATLVLPDVAVGTHSVTATFVPRDTATYDGSASAPATWLVVKASTRMRVPITGKRTDRATRVLVRTTGQYDTVPTGKVRIAVKRLATRSVRVKVRTLDAKGAATAGFGRLKKGRYRVTVVYRGDVNHRRIITTKTFRVRRA